MDAVQALLDLHGEVLERILELAGPGLTKTLAGDAAVSGLLLLHGLHPSGLDERVRDALESVRPYLGSHGGGVELLSTDDGVVRLRLEGSCNGCPSSTATLKYAIEHAILEAAPDVVRIDVDGVTPPAAQPGFVPLGTIRSSEPKAAWRTVDGLRDLVQGAALALEIAGVRIVLCLVGGTRYAYRDACPACGLGLHGATVEMGALTCPGCARRYDVRRAGRCLDGEGLHLEPVPLVAQGGLVRVSLPEQPVAVG